MVIEYIISGGLLGLFGLILKNNSNYDKKISRVYNRLDEVKKADDENYTRKDVCTVRHESIEKELVEIKAGINTLLSRMNNQ